MTIFPKTLPPELTERGKISKFEIITGNNFEVSLLVLSPMAKIKMHQHPDDIEYYFNLTEKTLSICEKGGSHELANNSETEELMVISIKVF